MDEVKVFEHWLQHSINMEHLGTLYNASNYEYGLDKPRAVCAALGHPETACRTIHVTGSKGKGSVSRMVAAILQAATAPQKVGVFASPHVYSYRERISAADGFFPDAVYKTAIHDFLTHLDREQFGDTSWFELVFPFAALCFKHARTSYAVYEVGMGGRLDATNVISPAVCCITPIELEHTEWLGDTLEQIATEKAGIIKPGVPVVIAAQKSESVCEVFRTHARTQHAPIYFVDDLAKIEQISYAGSRMHIEITGELFSRPIKANLQLLGDCQAKNAAEAAIAAKLILPGLDEDPIARGLEAATLPGRFEQRGNVILDGAHTPSSIAQTLTTFSKLYPGEKPNLLYASVAGKDIAHIVSQFKDKFAQVFLTIPGTFKKSDLSAVEQAFRDNHIDFISSDDYQSIIKSALDASRNTKLLVTGSFYLLAEVDKLWYN